MIAHLRRHYAPFLPLLLVPVVAFVGAFLNSVDARGRVIDDTDETPIAGIAVQYGSRSVITAPDGSYEMRALPRGVRVVAQKAGYGRSFAAAESNVLRLVPLTITFEVKDDTTGKGIDTPEARQPATVRIGTGSASGEMVVGPYPARDRPVLICAKDYESKEVTAKGVLMDVLLKPGGGGCPPLPTPVAPAQTASPSPRPSPAPPSPTGP